MKQKTIYLIITLLNLVPAILMGLQVARLDGKVFWVNALFGLMVISSALFIIWTIRLWKASSEDE